MNSAEIVVHSVKRNRACVVLDFLGESICQPSESPHCHPHREILAINVAGRDMLRVRVAHDRTTEQRKNLINRERVLATKDA